MGASGCGKTWIQRRLVNEHGFWAPRHVTTRQVSGDDFNSHHSSVSEFHAALAAGELAAPMFFGGYWHAWPREDVARLSRGEQPAVVVCRPYEALLLSAIQPHLIPVWLTADAALVAERSRKRAAERDRPSVYREARRVDDAEDAFYRECFRYFASTDVDAVPAILDIVGRISRAKASESCPSVVVASGS